MNSEEPRTVKECLEKHLENMQKFNKSIELSTSGLNLQIVIDDIKSFKNELSFIVSNYNNPNEIDFMKDEILGVVERFDRTIQIAEKELEKIDDKLEELENGEN